MTYVPVLYAVAVVLALIYGDMLRYFYQKNRNVWL